MDHFAMLAPHEQLVKQKNLKMILLNSLHSKGYNFQERFIRDLRNPLWTITSSRRTTGGPC